ncbi:MAG: methyltransferase [Chloroflexota bacterium]
MSRTLAGLIGGYRSTQMLFAAAQLGIADRLADGPLQSRALAGMVGADEAALRRLLRGLVNVGVLTEDAGGRFGLTPVGAALRTDVPGSQHAWAIWEGGMSYQAWGALLYSVQTGRAAFDHVFGRPFFAHFAAHPEAGDGFNRAMAGYSAAIATAVAQGYDFSPFRTVVDVGGGHGTLLAAVLRAYPHLTGVHSDLPSVAAGAEPWLAAAGVAGRCRIVSGDFFAAVPGGGDVYLLGHIVHDWDDAQAVRILRNCRTAMAGHGRLLIVEKHMPEPMTEGAVPPGTDVNMLVLTGGRERTDAEYRALLAAAGWRLERVMPTRSMASILEASPAYGLVR